MVAVSWAKAFPGHAHHAVPKWRGEQVVVAAPQSELALLSQNPPRNQAAGSRRMFASEIRAFNDPVVAVASKPCWGVWTFVSRFLLCATEIDIAMGFACVVSRNTFLCSYIVFFLKELSPCTVLCRKWQVCSADLIILECFSVCTLDCSEGEYDVQ